MRGATCFSGIGAPEVAMPHIDWIWHSEIEPFPCAVMAARHPKNQNLGDILAPDFIERANAMGPLDIMVGGPPCQAFSIAGLRQSLADPRGNLTLRWVQVLHAIRPTIAVTENVPGWLSTNDNAFGCFLAGIVGADSPLNSPRERGRWPSHGMVSGPLARAAWRVLDAQYVRTRSFPWAVPQRRRRVFVVISFGATGPDPAAVLFDRESLRGNPAPRREAGQGVAGTIDAGSGKRGAPAAERGQLIPDTAWCLQERDSKGPDSDTKQGHLIPVAHSLRAEGFDASEDGTGRGTPIVPIDMRQASRGAKMTNNRRAGSTGGAPGTGIGEIGDPCPSLSISHTPAIAGPIAFTAKDHGGDAVENISPTLRAGSHTGSHANAGVMPAVVFPLTPSEKIASNLEAEYLAEHASASKNDTYSALQSLRKAVGEEAFAEWGLGVSHSLQQAKVLRPEVHGEGVRGQAEDRDELGNHTLPRSEDLPSGAVRALWSAGCTGCPPQGWQPSEQLARELGAHLSKLSHPGTSIREFLHDLWRSSQGLGVLRQALSASEEARRSDDRQNSSQGEVLDLRQSGAQQGLLRKALHEGQACWGVRRLTPKEAERLMGFPDGFTAIPWRGKPAENCPDGPRYRALGNSMAVNCMTYLGERIQAVMEATDAEGA